MFSPQTSYHCGCIRPRTLEVDHGDNHRTTRARSPTWADNISLCFRPGSAACSNSETRNRIAAPLPSDVKRPCETIPPLRKSDDPQLTPARTHHNARLHISLSPGLYDDCEIGPRSFVSPWPLRYSLGRGLSCHRGPVNRWDLVDLADIGLSIKLGFPHGFGRALLSFVYITLPLRPSVRFDSPPPPHPTPPDQT
jgi:hypothetical protein